MIDDNIKNTLSAIADLYDYFEQFEENSISIIKDNFTNFKKIFNLLDTIYDSPDTQTIMDMTNDVSIVIPNKFSDDFQTYKQAYLPTSQSDNSRDCLNDYNEPTQPSAGKVSVSYTKRAEQALKASGNWRDDSSSSSESSSSESSSGDIDENNRIKDCSMFNGERATILNTIKYQEIINNFREIEGKFLNDVKPKYGNVGGLVSRYLYSGYSTENNKKMDIIDGFDITKIQSLDDTDLSQKIADYKQLSIQIKHRIEIHNESFDNLWNDFKNWAEELSNVRSKIIFGKFFNKIVGLQNRPNKPNQSSVNTAFFKNSFEKSFENCPDIIYFMMENFYNLYINDLDNRNRTLSGSQLKQIFMKYINDKRKILLHIKDKIEGNFSTKMKENIDAIEKTIIFFIYNVNLLYCKTKATDSKLDAYLQLLKAEKEKRDEKEKREREEREEQERKEREREEQERERRKH